MSCEYMEEWRWVELHAQADLSLEQRAPLGTHYREDRGGGGPQSRSEEAAPVQKT
jgi:hypothetical protein